MGKIRFRGSFVKPNRSPKEKNWIKSIKYNQGTNPHNASTQVLSSEHVFENCKFKHLLNLPRLHFTRKSLRLLAHFFSLIHNIPPTLDKI